MAGSCSNSSRSWTWNQKVYRIMPSSIRMQDGVITTATRSADRDNQGSIEVFISVDDGGSASFGDLSTNPADLFAFVRRS
jgi:hypothetical protein